MSTPVPASTARASPPIAHKAPVRLTGDNPPPRGSNLGGVTLVTEGTEGLGSGRTGSTGGGASVASGLGVAEGFRVFLGVGLTLGEGAAGGGGGGG